MNRKARLLQELRPPGPISAGCYSCVLFDLCGGIQNGQPLLNCFDQFCCDHVKCDYVCLYKPEDYRRRMQEIGGLRFDDIPPLHQASLSLPRYVPMIHHPSSRSGTLNANCVGSIPMESSVSEQGRYVSFTSL